MSETLFSYDIILPEPIAMPLIVFFRGISYDFERIESCSGAFQVANYIAKREAAGDPIRLLPKLGYYAVGYRAHSR